MKHLLINNGLKPTPLRVKLLEVIAESKYPLSQKDIETLFNKEIDRVTLYRNLKSFSEKKIIHKIEVNENTTTYNINRKSEEHLHFHCNVCKKVFCMPDLKIENYSLPPGFKKINSRLIIEGICSKCN